MATISQLTEEQFKTLLDEYFAPAEKRTKMTEAEIKDLAKQLNNKINVPLINETREEKILIKIVIQIDRFLYDNLPNEIYDLVRSLDKGISDDEAKRLIKRLSKLANERIDIPYIPESAEYVAIRFMIGVVINAARKAWDIDKTYANEANMNIPDTKEASDDELEAILA
jgi:hypothetical protein